MNMAIDEAILISIIESRSPNTLRLYRWHPSAVSIGNFQNIYEAVDLDRCRELGIDIVRRITGGGSVYHDFEGEITYSVIVRDIELGTRDTLKSYETICHGIIKALERLQLNAEFRGVKKHTCPDIVVNGKKISGNAQIRRRGVILHHGTLLLKADYKLMTEVLKIPKVDDKKIIFGKIVESVSSIDRELKINLSFESMSKIIVGGFKECFGIKMIQGKLEKHEMELAEKLRKEKYMTLEWNRNRTYNSDFTCFT
jgi:lipoate-protein ligase A